MRSRSIRRRGEGRSSSSPLLFRWCDLAGRLVEGGAAAGEEGGCLLEGDAVPAEDAADELQTGFEFGLDDLVGPARGETGSFAAARGAGDNADTGIHQPGMADRGTGGDEIGGSDRDRASVRNAGPPQNRVGGAVAVERRDTAGAEIADDGRVKFDHGIDETAPGQCL